MFTTSEPGSQPVPRPNLDEARRFLRTIDPDPGAQFGFRTCDDRGDDPRCAVKCFGTLDRGIRQSRNPRKDGQSCQPGRLLQYMQNHGAGAFAVVNKLDGLGQRKANVTHVGALFADADTAAQARSALHFAQQVGPTMVVASGGLDGDVEKLQIYWCVDGCPTDDFRAAMELLISRTGTDQAVKDLARVMRLPGFWHQKREPRQTRIIAADPSIRYGYRDLIARIQAQPQIASLHTGGSSGRTSPRRGIVGARLGAAATEPTQRLRVLLDLYGGLIAPAVRALLREAVAPTPAQPGNRHGTIISAVARCAQAGWSDENIHRLILPVINSGWQDGDWGDHLGRAIEWVRAQENAGLARLPAAPAKIAAAFGAGVAR